MSDDRKKQIEEGGHRWFLALNKELASANGCFQAGAEFADANPPGTSGDDEHSSAYDYAIQDPLATPRERALMNNAFLAGRKSCVCRK